MYTYTCIYISTHIYIYIYRHANIHSRGLIADKLAQNLEIIFEST